MLETLNKIKEAGYKVVPDPECDGFILVVPEEKAALTKVSKWDCSTLENVGYFFNVSEESYAKAVKAKDEFADNAALVNSIFGE